MSKTSEMKRASYIYIYILTAIILTSLSILSFLALSASSIFASDHVSNVSVTVPVSCNITSTLDTPHTETINPGQSKADIGTTTFKVFCNDNTGYAIYAIGYSGDEYGNTNMLPTNPATSTNPSIVTGTATSGDTSNWAMKITPVAGTYAPTIENGFNSYRTVPDAYTKVATLNTNTDFTIGSSFQSTYRVFVSQTQPADTYTGKVKYTLVHPHSAPKPVTPQETAELTDGLSVCFTISFSCGENDDYGLILDTSIKALKTANSLPEEVYYHNIASNNSYNPIYTWFDDTNDAGIQYFFTPARKIYMNPDSGAMFLALSALTDISALAEWDASNVTNMEYMFSHTGIEDVGNLANWYTSSVTNMDGMFSGATSLTNISGARDWDTSSVTNMNSMFYGATSLTNIDALANWNTSSVTNMIGIFANTAIANINALTYWDTSSTTNMRCMFCSASSLANINGARNWDTSKVTNMESMFQYASALTSIDGAKNWDTSNVTNMSLMFYDVNNIDATVLNSWNVSKVTNKSRAFTCPVDKQPCWYNGATCPTNSGGN